MIVMTTNVSTSMKLFECFVAKCKHALASILLAITCPLFTPTVVRSVVYCSRTFISPLSSPDSSRPPHVMCMPLLASTKIARALISQAIKLLLMLSRVVTLPT